MTAFHGRWFVSAYSLIFMGSEKYPYKGVLDNLANRAFSEGTSVLRYTPWSSFIPDNTMGL